MNKYEVNELLINSGYDSHITDGILMVRLKEKKQEKELIKTIKECCYHGTFGYRYKN